MHFAVEVILYASFKSGNHHLYLCLLGIRHTCLVVSVAMAVNFFEAGQLQRWNLIFLLLLLLTLILPELHCLSLLREAADLDVGGGLGVRHGARLRIRFC